jgi:hypothetical protein
MVANATVWAGFPSVDQADPLRIACAGQFNAASYYYDQDLNYAWVTNRAEPAAGRAAGSQGAIGCQLSASVPGARRVVVAGRKVVHLRIEPVVRPDRRQDFAIFIQDADDRKPAMQVCGCAPTSGHC